MLTPLPPPVKTHVLAPHYKVHPDTKAVSGFKLHCEVCDEVCSTEVYEYDSVGRAHATFEVLCWWHFAEKYGHVGEAPRGLYVPSNQ